MCFAAYGFTVTITMECGATVAENIPLRSPRSFACRRSRTRALKRAGYPKSSHATLMSASLVPRFSRTTAPASILHQLRPDFQIAVLAHSAALAACWILIDRNHFLVRENSANLRLHVAQIVARDQGSSQNRPKTEVGAVFRRGHSAIADFEHVRIIPVSRPGKGLKTNLQIQDVEHAVGATITGFPFLFALPSVLDVSGGAPKISYPVPPDPWPAGTPFANAEDNSPAGGVHRSAHDLIRRARILRRGTAPVIFQIIHTPSRTLPRVLKLISPAARPALTSLGSRIAV